MLTGSHASGAGRATRLAAPLLAFALAVAGCSGDDSSGSGDGPGSGTSSGGPSSVQTTAKVRNVTGSRLSKHRRHAVLTQVTAVVDGWWDAAYLSSGDDQAFPGFTTGAAKLAEGDRQIMTAAALPDGATDPVAVRRSVALDILAVHGRAAGVTATVALGVRTSGDTDRILAVRGLLQLTHDSGAWRVFGFDVTATPRVVGAEPQKNKESHRKKGRS